MPVDQNVPQIAILGPTCSGKSSLALYLAERLNAEILSCDSMQIYRGMDIGTAKPAMPDLQRHTHHLINRLNITEPYNSNLFVTLSRDILAAAALKSPPKPVILVGGTGLYAKSLIYRFAFKPADHDLYQALLQQSETPEGLLSLYREMASVNQPLADRLRQNRRRLIRAVESYRLTGAITAGDQAMEDGLGKIRWQQIILMPPSESHEKAIRDRVLFMLKNGWIEETRSLLEFGFEHTPTARQALGYQEVADYLKGKLAGGLPELAAKIILKTLHYAKRQKTWFRHQHPGSILVTTAHPETIIASVLRGIACQQVINNPLVFLP